MDAEAKIPDTFAPQWLVPSMKFQYNTLYSQVRGEHVETETCRDERVWGR